MKTKTKIYMLVLIWGAVILQLYVGSAVSREEKLVEQVMSEGTDNIVTSTVKAYAFYDDGELSEDARVLIARNLAMELGVTSGYEIDTRYDGNNATTELFKCGKYGDTEVKVITIANTKDNGEVVYENYIMMEIELKGAAGSNAYAYVEQLEDIYKELGMVANTNIYMCSQVPGEMTSKEMEAEAADFLDSMGATQIEEVGFDGIKMIYGYGSNIGEYVYHGDEKVNVNIAFTYDQEQDVTYIHRAIPFIDKSF